MWIHTDRRPGPRRCPATGGLEFGILEAISGRGPVSRGSGAGRDRPFRLGERRGSLRRKLGKAVRPGFSQNAAPRGDSDGFPVRCWRGNDVPGKIDFCGRFHFRGGSHRLGRFAKGEPRFDPAAETGTVRGLRRSLRCEDQHQNTRTNRAQHERLQTTATTRKRPGPSEGRIIADPSQQRVERSSDERGGRGIKDFYANVEREFFQSQQKDRCICLDHRSS